MTTSYTTSGTESFSLTHARKLAAKVIADMHQCYRLYGEPTDKLEDYAEELAQMLAGGYVESYEFGFKKNERRVVSWFYEVNESGDLEGGRSGGLYSKADIEGANHFNFMSYTNAWFKLTGAQMAGVKAKHAINRTPGSPPTDGDGHWVTDRSYGAGGVVLARREFRP